MAQLSLFIVVLLALIIPIFMARLNVNHVPTAVAEIIVGIMMGSSGFNLITNTTDLKFLSNLGVILLIFLSGMEIDFDLLSKNNKKVGQDKTASPLRIAIVAFICVALMSLVLAYVLKLLGLFSQLPLAAIIFMTVALGVVIATLKEKDILSRPIGQTILLTAVMGEVIPLILLTVYASIHSGNVEQLWLIIFLFVAAIFLLRRFRQPYLWFAKVTKATTQLDIRLAFFLIFALVTVAERVGAENILGSFLAGIVMKLLEPSEVTKDKLTSIGYGFFIPIFFIMTGVKLNLRNVFMHPNSLMLLPILVIFLFLAKLPVVAIYMKKFDHRNAFAGGLLTATTITIVLPTLEVARRLNAITSVQSDVFVLAAVLVCIISPIIFNFCFKLLPEDRIKQKVIIIGANTFTMPVVHDLHSNWYLVNIFTNNQNNYDTFKSRANLKLIHQFSQPELEKAGAFAGDIFVSALNDDQKNLALSKMAKVAGVKRVIIRLKQPDAATITELNNNGIEIFNFTNVRSELMRALIESPAVYQVITDTKNVLYSVVVNNSAYTGQRLMDWDFIDQMTISRIRREGKWILPHGSTIIQLSDQIVFSGEFRAVDKIKQILSKNN